MNQANQSGNLLSLVARQVVIRVLKKALAWMGGLFAGCLPVLAVLCAGMIVVGLIIGVITNAVFREDKVVKESWPESLQERAERVAANSVNRAYPDEEAFALPVELLAAVRMSDPGLKTDQYDVELMGDLLKPEIARGWYTTTTVTTVSREVCDDVSGTCEVESQSTEEQGTQYLIEEAITWNGVHHLTYRQETARHEFTNENGDHVVVETTFWVPDNHTFTEDYSKLKAALVQHDPPLGSYDHPDELEERVNWIVWFMDNHSDPFAQGISIVDLPDDLYDGVVLDGDWMWPVKGQPKVTSLFGWRISPVDGVRRFHGGIDLIGDDLAIRAVAAGTVVESTVDDVYGQRLVVDHGNGVKTTYSHLRQRNVKKGQYVRQGDVLGIMGRTGKSTGVHLHFEVYVMDTLADPLKHMFPDITYTCIDCL